MQLVNYKQYSLGFRDVSNSKLGILNFELWTLNFEQRNYFKEKSKHYGRNITKTRDTRRRFQLSIMAITGEVAHKIYGRAVDWTPVEGLHWLGP